TQDPESRLKLADVLNVIGQNAAAADIYRDLLKRLANVPFARDSIRAKLTEIYLRNHDRKQAAEQLEDLIQDNPTDPQAYYVLGDVAYDAKDYSRAIDCFSRTVVLSPDFEPAYYQLARAQLSADKASDAIETLDRLKRRVPDATPGFIAEYLTG